MPLLPRLRVSKLNNIMKKPLVFGISLFLIISIILVIATLSFGTQITTMVFCKITLAKHPVVYKVPEKIVLENYTFTNTTKFSCFGYDFEFPWSDVAKESVSQKFARIQFKSGIWVAVLSPEFAANFVEEYRKKDSKMEKVYSFILDEKTFQSEYDFHKAILNTTPHDLSLFKSPGKDIGIAILLTFKSLLAHLGDSGIYEFDNGNFCAFQFGNPLMSRAVMISVFSGKDTRLDLLIVDKKNKNKMNVSQKEINFIISSIKFSKIY